MFTYRMCVVCMEFVRYTIVCRDIGEWNVLDEI